MDEIVEELRVVEDATQHGVKKTQSVKKRQSRLLPATSSCVSNECFYHIFY